MYGISTDLWLGWRQLRSHPLFALSAISTIGLAIAANTIIASIAAAVLLRPLPVPEPGMLVRIGATRDGRGHLNVSVPEYEDLRKSIPSLDGVAAQRVNEVVFNAGIEPRQLGVEFVSDNYFEVLGVTPAVGILVASGERSIVISHALWQSALGGSADIVGAPVRASGPAG